MGTCLTQVLVSDPSKLEQIRERETDITKERIQKVACSHSLCHECCSAL